MGGLALINETVDRGGRIFTTRGTVDHENTTTETVLAKRVIPRNTLKPGSLIQAFALGFVEDNNSTDELQMNLRLGPSTTALGSRQVIVQTTSVDVNDNDVATLEALCTVHSTGSSGTFGGFTTYRTWAAAGSLADVYARLAASTTLNTTVDLILSISAVWTVAHADNEMQLESHFLEVITDPETAAA